MIDQTFTLIRFFLKFQDDPFSMSNLIRMGIKVALAVFSSYTNDDIDRIDKVSPTQVKKKKRLRESAWIPFRYKIWNRSCYLNLPLLIIFQAVLGTIISAVTGSENPQEVAVMAKQATDVSNYKFVNNKYFVPFTSKLKYLSSFKHNLSWFSGDKSSSNSSWSSWNLNYKLAIKSFHYIDWNLLLPF